MNTYITNLTFLVLLVAGLCSVASAQSTSWSPVTPAELEMKTPKVEPTAHAEAIFWEVRLDNKKTTRLTYEHYVRIKLFTERGREKYSKMDIPFTKGMTIEDIAARVTKTDGSAVELRPSDIIEREVVKTNKRRVLSKSFALPGLEPGAIVEYRYKETFKDTSAEGARLIFQRELPIQRASYYVRPSEDLKLIYRYFNMPETTFQPDRDGYVVAHMYDVPAFAEEPYMPPPDEVRRWVYLSYNMRGWVGGFNWSWFAFDLTQVFARMTEPNKDIKRKADEITAGAATDDEKVRRIYTFAQRQIRNASFDRSLTEEQRDKADAKDPGEVLKRGVAGESMIDMLFASLVKSAGLEVNLVFSGNRSENFFTPEKYPSRRFVHIAGIAVRFSDKTIHYFEPGVPYMPYGSVFWYEEMIKSLQANTGSKDTIGSWSWTNLPLKPASESNAKRTGRFTLSENGSLRGHVRADFTGHEAITRRSLYYFDSPEKRVESFKSSIRARFTSAEVTNLAISNFDDNEKPLTYDYDITVPNYAQVTGKRMFVQPGYFEYGVSPVFSSATRKNSVYFDFPWSEDDDVEITFPLNYAGEGVTSPAPITESKNVGTLEISVSTMTSKDRNILKYIRQFQFGGPDSLLFPASSYLPLKALFDRFSKADTQSVTLRTK